LTNKENVSFLFLKTLIKKGGLARREHNLNLRSVISSANARRKKTNNNVCKENKPTEGSL
jgi:hypothetical protein